MTVCARDLGGCLIGLDIEYCALLVGRNLGNLTNINPCCGFTMLRRRFFTAVRGRMEIEGVDEQHNPIRTFLGMREESNQL